MNAVVDIAIGRRLPIQPFNHLGVVLSEVGFDELSRIRGALHQAGAAADLMPMFKPSRTRLPPELGFALIGSQLGAALGLPTVITAASVVRDCAAGLRNAIERMTLFSDRPVPGEYASLHGSTELLDQVKGRIAVIGGVWRSDSLAGTSVLRMLWPLLLQVTVDRLRPDWVVGLIRGGKHGKIGFEIEGFRLMWEGVAYRDPDWNGGHQVEDFVICAMSWAQAMNLARRSILTFADDEIRQDFRLATEAHAGASLSTAPPTG